GAERGERAPQLHGLGLAPRSHVGAPGEAVRDGRRREGRREGPVPAGGDPAAPRHGGDASKAGFLEKKIEQELAAARKHGTKNKRAALQALKRKKRYEKQLAQIDGTLSTIEFQREALENANTNTEVLKNMGFAAKAMKAAHDNMDIDKVDELMQDIAEQQELADEISTAISKPVGFGEEFDEDELMAELEELEQEELDKNLLEISGPETVPLPNVPSISIPSKPAKKKEEEEDDDMKELEAWAGTM
uniref:Charged multivesicular body protein 4B n=1 Tax=Malurus cyaneus samueli TaxID=2593467 RepID=A0A8C5TJE8_9PASS